MSAEKQGIKETKEVLALIGVIAGVILEELKGDGLQLSDLEKVVTKPEFLPKLLDAVAGSSAVPAEIKNATVFDVFDLIDDVSKIGRGIVQGVSELRSA